MFMNEDTYELKTVYVHGNIDYDLFGVGFANGNAGLKRPLKQTGQLFFIEGLRNIGWKFFVGNCIYGANNELRGYQAGRYLDRYMFATQLEYRLVLLCRLGVVAFGGLGSVVPGDQSPHLLLYREPAGKCSVDTMTSSIIENCQKATTVACDRSGWCGNWRELRTAVSG